MELIIKPQCEKVLLRSPALPTGMYIVTKYFL